MAKAAQVAHVLDSNRTLRYVLSSGVFAGVTCFEWLKFVNHMFPGSDIGTVLLKVTLDMALYGPAVFGSVFVINSYMEGRDGHYIKTKMKAESGATLKYGSALWIPTNLVKYTMVPPPMQAAFTKSLDLVWSVIFCFLLFRPLPTDSKAIPRDQVDRNVTNEEAAEVALPKRSQITRLSSFEAMEPSESNLKNVLSGGNLAGEPGSDVLTELGSEGDDTSSTAISEE